MVSNSDEPILAKFSAAPEYDPEHPRDFVVYGGLHYHQGNSAPYFSLTYLSYLGRREEGGGADHTTILEHCPQFADLAALHLSDINGVPMHAVENGWYWLTGSLPEGAGEKFHGGNGPIQIKGEYRAPDADECLTMFEEYLRVGHHTGFLLRSLVIDAAFDKTTLTYDWTAGRKVFVDFVTAQGPRWKREANACIAAHGLVVYGDKWEEHA